MIGKKLRLKRFTSPRSKNSLIVPLDHGLTWGPVPGLESIKQIARWIRHPAIGGVIAHKGMAERLIEADLLDGVGLMIHLNGMSGLSMNPDRKERLTSLESALGLGADAVSFQINFDGYNDAENLQLMGQVVDEALPFGLPVLAMVYDKVTTDEKRAIDRLRHLMRIALELGCDAIKIAPPAPLSLLPQLLSGIASDIPIFLAGGALTDDESLWDLTRAALHAGARGLCIGRNVFQRQDCHDVLTRLQELLGSPPLRVFELPWNGGMANGAH